MHHLPICLTNLSLFFPQKVCFEGFTTQIHTGSRIGIIGQNGSGKSMLLHLLQQIKDPSEGSVQIAPDVIFGFVPQTREIAETCSGGEHFNVSLSHALERQPNILLLDEPTNHLDIPNRRSLLRMLHHFRGTLIIASHDPELLRTCVTTLWHIESPRIHVFAGNYDDYQRERQQKRDALGQELLTLEQAQRETHASLMKEQIRAKNARLRGEKHVAKRKWPTILSSTKLGRGNSTSKRKKKAIQLRKEKLTEQIPEMRLPEILTPRFSIRASDVMSKPVLSIQEGSCGYGVVAVLEGIHFHLRPRDRVALTGANGSGKTTLLRAILKDPIVQITGTWCTPPAADIGYLDQYYATLNPEMSALETLQRLRPDWTYAEVRAHLNDFLFRKNEEVNALVENVSGGEKARLSLAQIAARTPRLLILDEVTNNLDLETRAYVIQVLKQYSGALLVISHDENFLRTIHLTRWLKVEQGQVIE